VTGDWLPFLPHLVLLGGGVLIFGGARLFSRPAVWRAAGLLVVTAAAVCAFGIPAIRAATSPFATAVYVAFLFAAGALILGAWHKVGPDGPTRTYFETHGLVLCGVACAMLTAFVEDAIFVFALLEFTTFAATALAAQGEPGASVTGVLRRANAVQLVSAGLLLLALFLITFDQGTTNLAELREQFTEAAHSGAATGLIAGPSRVARAAFVLLFAAAAVKAFLVPFHFGSPEFLTKSSTTACSYALVVSRGAALIVLFRVGMLAFVGFESPGLVVAAVLSGGTMLVGSALAVGRGRLRETLTYLLIGQGGLVLFGLAIAWGRATTSGGQPSFLARGETAAGLTLLAVSLSVLGIFNLLNHLRSDDCPVEYVEELTGLLRDRPLVAAALVVLLLNLVGVPPLPGFWSRMATVTSALSVTKQPADAFPTPHPAFLILIVAMAVQILMTAGIVFRLVAVMVFDPPVARRRAAGGWPALFSGVLCAAVVVVIGFMPSRTIATLNSVIPQPGNIHAEPSASAGSSRSVMRTGQRGSVADAGWRPPRNDIVEPAP
jgi:NADH-quinone oxidoreductase subunit N